MECDGGLGNSLHPDALCDAQRHQIERALQCNAQWRRTAEFHFEVMRTPSPSGRVHNDRCIEEALAGRDAPFQCRQIHEWLEAGTRLALCLCSAIELATFEAPSANQRQ